MADSNGNAPDLVAKLDFFGIAQRYGACRQGYGGGLRRLHRPER